jgi:hypothetical protein
MFADDTTIINDAINPHWGKDKEAVIEVIKNFRRKSNRKYPPDCQQHMPRHQQV